MRALTRMSCAGVVCAITAIGTAAAQSPQPPARPSTMQGCASERTGFAAQTLRCAGGVTIVAEDGAQFTLQDRDHDGAVDSVDLHSKALLLDAPAQRPGHRFVVSTPQAIAAVRGTRWAVDAN